MTVSEEKIKEKLLTAPFFAGFSQGDLDSFWRLPQVKKEKYLPGSHIFFAGDVPEKFYILLTGAVRILQETYGGQELHLADISETGDLFGEVYLFIRRQNYDMTARIITETTVLGIDKTLFSPAAQESGLVQKLQYNLLNIFAGKAFFLNRKLRVLASGSLRKKIIRYLWQQTPDENGWIYLGRRETLASYLAVTRPSLSRELLCMQEEGLITLQGQKAHLEKREMTTAYL